MKILIAGDWRWHMYEVAFAKALTKMEIEVLPFKTSDFFNGKWGHIQQMIPLPLASVKKLNKALLQTAKDQEPDYVLCWRPVHILPSSVKALAENNIQTISYNNDDPFGPQIHTHAPWHHKFLWHWYKESLPHYHYNFFYRKINCEEARSYKVKHADVLLPYFLPWQEKPVTLTDAEKEKFETDVVFAGHYENDGREQYILALLKQGIRAKVWGGHYWNTKTDKKFRNQIGEVMPALGDDYVKALCGAKICLAFLSKLNRDTYTRRCFEIPACGKLMLAERTDDLMKFFKEDEEACFFSSKEELIAKAKWLLQNPQIREKIAAAGMKRVWQDGHDVFSRAEEFLRKILY